MSRSLVNLGCACSTTATPPTMTKSTSARTRRESRRVGWKSVHVATRTRSGEHELAALRRHPFELSQPLARRKLELLANEALVDASLFRRRVERELEAERVESVGHRADGRIAVGALEGRDRGLCRSHAGRELTLGNAGLPALDADELTRTLYRFHAI